jgi:hypothetical protein
LEFLVGKLQAGYSHVNTVHRVHYNKIFQRNADAGWREFAAPGQQGNFEERPYFRVYGVFSGFSYAKRRGPSYYHVLTNEIMRVDIDAMEDFLLAGMLIEHSMFDFLEAM